MRDAGSMYGKVDSRHDGRVNLWKVIFGRFGTFSPFLEIKFPDSNDIDS
jgi:hypothetical protein